MKKSLRSGVLAILLCMPYFLVSQALTHYQSFNSMRAVESGMDHIKVSFTLPGWTFENVAVDRESLSRVNMTGSFLPNDEGAPDLPSVARFIAFPKGTHPMLIVNYGSIETVQNIDLAPAPRIPKTTENGPLHYEKNPAIWSNDSFYPAQPVLLSEETQIRGVDVVMLGITPFQYNPVTRELKIYHDLDVEVVFEQVAGSAISTVGEERLRSRFWDPILSDAILNSDIIPQVDYLSKLERAIQDRQSAVGSQQSAGGRDIGCEYLIIVPNQPDFLAWADTLRRFRNEQGIMTDVLTTTDVGGNSVAAIESFVNTAYNTWDIVPAAILLLGDYATGNDGIIAPIWDNYCASDNIYADVNNNDMPDIVFSRMTAENASHLEILINKIVDYETDPPVDFDYYDHPITALGWQTERWFQVCIEVVGGFFRNELGKDPVRINEVYDGNPVSDPWSTAPNTGTIMNYFGPNGLGYIPGTPSELGNWSGGNATMITNAINDGSFLLLHRDHGYELGWGEPAYSNSNLSGLDNEYPTFVYSVNCLTGKYNWGGECFTEAFHRYPKRAFGLIAASEVSYSFVNDTYVWGAFDNMWPEFMPDYDSEPAPRGLYPSFSNAAGKYFLQQSGWPYNTGNKEVTYNLFHHHGDAFNELYSEVPQDLTVLHNGVIIGGSQTYTVQADTLSWIALSVNGEILGVAQGTGTPVDISIPSQVPGTEVKLVITKTNHFRYEMMVPVIAPTVPYVVYQAYDINDDNGNGNDMMDYGEHILLGLTVQNIGMVDAMDVTVTLASQDPYVTLVDSSETYGNIAGNASMAIADAFAFDVSGTIPDGHQLFFDVIATDGDSTWVSQCFLVAHAPVLSYVSFEIDDTGGDGNGRLDPGETVEITVTVTNNGSSDAFDVVNELTCDQGYIDVVSGPQNAGDLVIGGTAQSVFSVFAGENTPGGLIASFLLGITGELGVSGVGEFTLVIGQYPAVIVDLDPNNLSGPVILQTFSNMDLFADYQTQMPDDLIEYKSVFLSLGIQFSNHELTTSEAAILQDYLDNGGKLFMEGRTTWYDDEQTVVHPMFNATAVFDNWFVIDTFYGEEGTFTEGMTFGFEGTNPYNKYHLEAVPPAYQVFRTAESGKGTWIANDAGTYKTIAASMEFGGLTDGEFPSTKENLMMKILEFFGDIVTGNEENSYGKTGNISVYPNPFTEHVVFDFFLEEKSTVRLDIFTLTGQKIATVFEGNLPAGAQRLEWNDPGIGAGMCFYRMETGKNIFSGKLIMR